MTQWYDEAPTGAPSQPPSPSYGTTSPSSGAPQDRPLLASGGAGPAARHRDPDARRWSGRRTAGVAALVLALTTGAGVAAAVATPEGIAGPSEQSRFGGGPGGFPGGQPGQGFRGGRGSNGQPGPGGQSGHPGQGGQPGQPGQPSQPSQPGQGGVPAGQPGQGVSGRQGGAQGSTR